jgi:hypothetical protein
MSEANSIRPSSAAERLTPVQAGSVKWRLFPADHARLREVLEAPDEILARPEALLQDTGLVTFSRVTLADGTPALLRRTNYTKPSARWRDAVRGLAVMRALHCAIALQRAGIPTPQVFAAGTVRKLGLPMAGYLVVEEVLGAVTLARCAADPACSASPRSVRLVAEAIAKLHLAGWRHGDLTINNILLDAQGLPWFIDLDRARRVIVPMGWLRAVEDFHRFARHVRGFRRAAWFSALRLLRHYCALRGWQGREREFAQAIARRLRRKWAADDAARSA